MSLTYDGSWWHGERQLPLQPKFPEAEFMVSGVGILAHSEGVTR